MDSSLTPTYFTALHDEAFSLLVESRDYIAKVRAQRGQRSLDQSGYLEVTLETMRLTTRLTQVMAWILAQRAVHSEELTPEEGASRAYQLSGQAVCLDNVSGQAGTYPKNCASYCSAATSSINELAVWKHRLTVECRRLNGNLRTERPI